MKTVYLIEDDIDDQDIFRMALDGVDKTITCDIANNGSEAIELFKSQTSYAPDYIFMDVNMPKMNGVDCLRELKQLTQLSNTRIIMFSTSEEPRIVNQCKQLGANHFIVKPASIDSLTLTLSKILQH